MVNINANGEAHTGSIYESAQECLEDNLQALSSETLIALKTVLGIEICNVWLVLTIDEILESRQNAAA
jgi:hypothetical protein